jgi:MraZ protein
MLRGEYQYTLDDKGRVVIPPKFRRALGDEMVLARGIGDQCITVYSSEEWAKVEEALKRLPFKQRDVLRYAMAGATEAVLDRQGRVVVPQHLRDHAGIEGDVVVVGLGSRLEIWNRSTWQTYLKKAAKSAPEIAEQIEELSI